MTKSQVWPSRLDGPAGRHTEAAEAVDVVKMDAGVEDGDEAAGRAVETISHECRSIREEIAALLEGVPDIENRSAYLQTNDHESRADALSIVLQRRHNNL